MDIIQLKKASKKFRESFFTPSKIVLKDINLTVRKGEFVILKGENGSGKTTLLNLLCGLLQPSSGQVKLMGLKPQLPDSRFGLGCVLQNTDIPDNIKVKELIELWQSYYPHPFTIGEILKRVNLEKQAESWANDLSGGQKQRLYFGLALIGNPQLLILDEPTRNLDDDSYEDFWKQIAICRQEEKTILMVTNNQSDQEKLKQFQTRIVTLQDYSENVNNLQLIEENNKDFLMSDYNDQEKDISLPLKVNYLNTLIKQIRFEGLQLIRTPSFLVGIFLMSLIPFLFVFFSDLLEVAKNNNRLSKWISSNLDLDVFNNPIPQLTAVCGILLFIIVIERLAKRIAIERSEKWLNLFKVSPIPSSIYITAKLFTVVLISFIFIATYFGIATLLLNIEITLNFWINTIPILTLGIIPFALLGLALGFSLEPKSADSILGYSLILIPILSGAFSGFLQYIPYSLNYSLIGDVLVLSPFYHYFNLVKWGVDINNDGQVVLHILWLLWATLLFGGLAVWSYQRENLVKR
ncbi:MAG: ABC transporter ATP-binding protein/permease [Halothece sp. Uz-M2-17]|nr:ABC transporter ATP-binding protein/permease [Halothece sp. Uz-M2-17]